MEDKEKLKEVKRQEKWDTKVAKWQKKYGDRVLNSWVEEHPNSLLKLCYEVWLGEENNINEKRIMAYICYAVALIFMFLSLCFYGFLLTAIIFLLLGSDGLTNVRIDHIEQKQMHNILWSLYRSEKEEEEDKNEKKK